MISVACSIIFSNKTYPIKTTFFKSWPFDWFPKWPRCFQLWFQVTAIGLYPTSRLEEPGRWLATKRIFLACLPSLKLTFRTWKHGWNTIVSFLFGLASWQAPTVSFRECFVRWDLNRRRRCRTVDTIHSPSETNGETLEMDGFPSSESRISRDLSRGWRTISGEPIFSKPCEHILRKISIQPKKQLKNHITFHPPLWFLLVPAIYYSSYMYIFQYYIQLLKPASPTLVALLLHQRRMPKILDSNKREEADTKNMKKTAVLSTWTPRYHYI